MDLLLAYDLAALEKLAETRSRLDLALMCAHLMYLRIERLDATVICLEGHSADLVGPVRKPLGLDERPHCMSAHELRTVQQRKAFLRLELHRLPSELGPYFSRRTYLALVVYLSEAYERKAHMRQRSEVARSSERTLLVYNREDIVIEHVHEALHCDQLHA